jgi:hypothetical protein
LIDRLCVGEKQRYREDAKRELQSFAMHRKDKELVDTERDKDPLLEKEERKKVKIALVMKSIGNCILKNGSIDRGLVISKIAGTMSEEELRSTKIFAYHYSTNSYSFATKAFKTVYQVSDFYSLSFFVSDSLFN